MTKFLTRNRIRRLIETMGIVESATREHHTHTHTHTHVLRKGEGSSEMACMVSMGTERLLWRTPLTWCLRSPGEAHSPSPHRVITPYEKECCFYPSLPFICSLSAFLRLNFTHMLTVPTQNINSKTNSHCTEFISDLRSDPQTHTYSCGLLNLLLLLPFVATVPISWQFSPSPSLFPSVLISTHQPLSRSASSCTLPSSRFTHPSIS